MIHSRSPRRCRPARRAFTLVEAIVVIIILAVLATLIAPRLIGRVGQSKQSTAKANASSLAQAVTHFTLDHGAPEPGASIDILWEKPANVPEEEWEPYVQKATDLNDPWGAKFILRVPGQVNVDFDIVSYGRDGQPGGTGEDADVVAP